MATLSKVQKAQRYEEILGALQRTEKILDQYREDYINKNGEYPEFDAAALQAQAEQNKSLSGFTDRSSEYGIRNGELDERLSTLDKVENLKEFRKGEDRVTAHEMIDARIDEVRKYNFTLKAD